MTNSEIFDEITAILADDTIELPDRVTNRMILAAIRENYRATAELQKKQSDSEIKVNEAVRKVEVHLIESKEYPSLSWLWAHEPKSTLFGIALVFLALMALYTAGIIELSKIVVF